MLSSATASHAWHPASYGGFWQSAGGGGGSSAESWRLGAGESGQQRRLAAKSWRLAALKAETY